MAPFPWPSEHIGNGRGLHWPGMCGQLGSVFIHTYWSKQMHVVKRRLPKDQEGLVVQSGLVCPLASAAGGGLCGGV